MANFVERLGYIITANGKDAVREFKQVRDSATRDLGATGKATQKLGSNFAGLSAGLKGFGAGILASVGIGAVDDLAQAASDLEQSVGAIESVFGDASTAIEAFGEQAAQTAGLSKSQVNQMAAVVGAQLKGMGFEINKAADMAITLEKRAADLAATFGGPTNDAVSAISATLRGERDPIERYGVSIKEADVQARIAAMGLDTTTISAKKYASAVATLDLLLEQTTSSQGQFNREMNTAAGAQSRAAAEYANAKAELGESLLPAQTAVTNFAARQVRGIKNIAGAIKGLFGSQKDVKEATDDATDAQEAQAEAMREAAEAAERAEASIEEYKGALDDLTSSAFDVAEAEDKVAQGFDDLLAAADENAKRRSTNAKQYADAVERANKRIADAEDDVADAREDLNKIPSGDRSDARRRLEDAEERLAEVRQESEESIAAAREAREEFDEWTPSLDRATTAGRKNHATLREITEEALATALQMKEEGDSALEINTYLRTQLTRMTDIATQVGFARDAMQVYLDLLKQAAALENVKYPGEAPGWRPPMAPGYDPATGTNRNKYPGEAPGWMPPMAPGYNPATGNTVIQNFYGQTDPVVAGREADRALRRRG